MINIENVDVWILKTNTAGGRIAKALISKNVAAVGWSINENRELKEKVYGFDDYIDKASKIHANINIVKTLVNKIKINDLIWIRDADDGLYYIGKRTEKSKWQYSISIEDYELDIQNQLTDIVWKPVGDESAVPGVITCHFHRPGQTLFCINTGWESAIRYSTKIYNKLVDNIYDSKRLKYDKDNFFNMLSPDEVEDLIYFYLYDKYGYIVVPSSNKIGTPNYEYVLLDKNDTNKKIYVQAKNGNIDLNYEDYKDLVIGNNEFYLFTRGEILGDKIANVIRITDTELFEWLQKDNVVVSDAISKWLEFISDEEFETECKGIMFDTNKSYFPEDEIKMLLEHMVWAKGNAKKYVNSFNKNDYVLFYSKGNGIIAIGKIKDEKSYEIDEGNGLARNVEIIVPNDKYLENIKEQKSIYPNEIKQLLNKSFYFASTIKTPYLSENEVQVLIEALESKYNK